MATSRYILDNALDAVGNTPIIRLDKIAAEEGLKCNLLGKVEFLSVGGSVKDRIAKAMVLAAEKEGRLIPGQSVVIEPTSGNTGIGLAMACAIKGYSVIITLPNKMSREKEALLRALGAKVIRTPDGEPWDSPNSHIGVAQRLQREIPHAVILDQYGNVRITARLARANPYSQQVNNPLAHEYATGPEIIDAVISTPSSPLRPSSMKVDALIASAGTGGTITGISRALKKTHNSDCIVVGVDPVCVIHCPFSHFLTPSMIAFGSPYVVEGIGYDFIPEVLSRDPGDVDTWLKTTDEEAFKAVQRLMRKEGLLVGGSSGSALSGTLTWLKSKQGRKFADTEGMNVVVLLPDGIRNYMSKEWFLNLALRSEPSPLADQSDELEASMRRASL
ncbi:pyridoxal phosphate-dependent enzyme beta subunit [Butyriboletus roseoflavus]|nr:pyridoxal phosphate-dependent enzyme beta subunit [Butyriboletus roseoflavus]